MFLPTIFSVISSLRVGFKLDSITGEPAFEIGLGDIQAAETTLEEIFTYLEQADKPCIVAIDEFQQIGTYTEKNVEAILRTKIQHCKNSFFVFAGSQRHIMMNMFNSPARPFYQSVTMMHLEAILLEAYTPFVKGLFRENGKEITDELIEEVYRFFEGHTWYMQLLFNELFIMTEKDGTCDHPLLEAALGHIMAMQDFTYQEIFSRLPDKQKEVMIAIAKEGKAEGITSAQFVKRYRLHSSSSVQAGVKGLLEKDLITLDQGVYQVYDRLFTIWITQNY